MSIQFRSMGEADVGQACELLRRGMPEKEYSHTIFACSGYPEYLKASCRCGAQGATLLFGAFREKRLIGFAEWRRLEQMLVLNNLNVDEEFRGQGIAGRLVAVGERLAREEGVRTLALDVFSWNRQASAWYERLGFVETGRTYWYEGDLAELAEPRGGWEPLNRQTETGFKPARFIIEDYPMAEAHHAAYGFSAFKLRTARGSAMVGRLGDGFYRIQAKDEEWNLGGQLTEVLESLGTGRRLLLLSPDARLAEADSRLTPFSESIRMIRMLEQEAVPYEAS